MLVTFAQYLQEDNVILPGFVISKGLLYRDIPVPIL
jgi:hypothetical protein